MTIVRDLYVMPSIDVTSANLTKGVPDAENQVYDAGRTYAAGDLSWHSGHVWESLVGANTGNTPVEGAFWTDRGAVDQGADLWVSGSYAKDVWKVLNSRLWRSTKDINTSTPGDPEKADDWTDYGATNRFRAFNGFVEQGLSFDTSLTMEIDLTSRLTNVVVFAPKGATVQALVKNGAGTTVFDETKNVVRSTSSYFAYHFSPIDVQSALIFSAIPPYSTGTLIITLTAAAGQTVGAGLITLGFARARASVVVGSYLGLRSRSRKEVSEFGVPSITRRPPSRRVGFTAIAPDEDGDDIFSELSKLEAVPSTYFMLGGESRGMVVHGHFKDFQLLYPNGVMSEYLLEIDGYAE